MSKLSLYQGIIKTQKIKFPMSKIVLHQRMIKKKKDYLQ